jgi:hypothetical protein
MIQDEFFRPKYMLVVVELMPSIKTAKCICCKIRRNINVLLKSRTKFILLKYQNWQKKFKQGKLEALHIGKQILSETWIKKM